MAVQQASPEPSSPLPHGLRVAMLEDDDALREAILLPVLRDYGFVALGAGTAAELYRLMLGQPFDIVVLDIGLPDENGLDVVRHLRKLFPDLGIVMLTGSRGSDKRVRALTEGADGYLTKPVDGGVLAATLHSLARRLARTAAPAPEKHVDVAAAPARWRVDTQGWCLVAPNGALMALTLSESRLLQMLVGANGHPVARDALLDAMADISPDFDVHRLEMLVHRLRRKAAELADDPLPLLAVRGIGYLFAPHP